MRFSRNSRWPKGSASKPSQKAGRSARSRSAYSASRSWYSLLVLSTMAWALLSSSWSSSPMRRTWALRDSYDLAQLGRGVAGGQLLGVLPQLRQRHVDEVAGAHHGLVDAHGDHRLHVGHRADHLLDRREVLDGVEVRLAHHPAVDGERVLGALVVDLELAAQAALDGAAHAGVEGVEERAAHHHQHRAEQDDAADDGGLGPAGEQVAEGDAEQHSAGGEARLGGHGASPTSFAAAGSDRAAAGSALAPWTASRPAIWPSAMRTMALAWAITLGSWVEKTKVVPSLRFMSRMRSMMFWPVAESRLAVGSSASTSAGRVTRARATATRCRWPPESSLGRWRAYSPMPTASSRPFTRGAPLLLREAALQEQRELDVLEDREHLHQVEALEDEADAVEPQIGERPLRELRGVLAVHLHRAAGRGVDAADQVEQRGLARARRPGDGEELAAVHVERHAAQRVDVGLAEQVVLGDVPHRDD